MTTKHRLRALESRLAPPDDRHCYLIIDTAEDGLRWPSRCPRGRELDAELSQCEACSIRPENQTRIILHHVPPDARTERGA